MGSLAVYCLKLGETYEKIIFGEAKHLKRHADEVPRIGSMLKKKQKRSLTVLGDSTAASMWLGAVHIGLWG